MLLPTCLLLFVVVGALCCHCYTIENNEVKKTNSEYLFDTLLPVCGMCNEAGYKFEYVCVFAFVSICYKLYMHISDKPCHWLEYIVDLFFFIYCTKYQRIVCD